MSTVGRVVFGPETVTAPLPDADQWRRWQVDYATPTHACGCVGPQRGQTKCPCALRAESERGALMVRDGVTINGQRYRLVPEDAP